MKNTKTEIGKDDMETLVDILSPYLKKAGDKVEIIVKKDGSIVGYKTKTTKSEVFRLE